MAEDPKERWAFFSNDELAELRNALKAAEVEGDIDTKLAVRLYDEVEAMLRSRNYRRSPAHTGPESTKGD